MRMIFGECSLYLADDTWKNSTIFGVENVETVLYERVKCSNHW